VADKAERSHLCLHYTSVPNILTSAGAAVFGRDLERAGECPQALRHLRRRLARVRVFDPACGSGNFWVIAYKELRKIEREINARLGEPERRTGLCLDNFRGIELLPFPTQIARLALTIAGYQCDEAALRTCL